MKRKMIRKVNQESIKLEKKKLAITKKKKRDLNKVTLNDENKQINSNSDNKSILRSVEHEKLMQLKDNNLEFYKHLKENDKNLLNFNISEDDDNSLINNVENEFLITMQLLKTWQQKIQIDEGLPALNNIAVSPVQPFLNILHITTNKGSIMYEKYIENAISVLFSTLLKINFMRCSSVETYLLDHNTSYSHVSLLVKQLTNLKNVVLKKELFSSRQTSDFQTVYNWQYINYFRIELIIKSKDKSTLRSLLYTLIIILEIRKINPIVHYLLRFHYLEMLIIISKKTGIFISILPFFLEISIIFKNKAVTVESIPSICILKVSKSQLVENSFKDNIIKTFIRLCSIQVIKYIFRIFMYNIISCIIKLKRFLKKCHVTYCNLLQKKKIKQLLAIIEENKRYENEQNRINTDGDKFYISWIKLRKFQKLKFFKKDVKEFNIPIKRKLKK
ncbi:hypothetical protein P5V15_003344 [Pogonomyrmex californicus]